MNTPFPLASNQRDVWYDQLAYIDSPLYNIAGYLCIEGELSFEFLKNAFQQLVSENEALRLSVYQENGNLLQSVNNEIDFNLEFIDFSNTENAKFIALEWIKNALQKPFVLGKNEKTTQFVLIKIQSNLHYLFTKYHHIVADGWSTTVTLIRLGELYNALLENRPSENLTQYRYADYVEQERNYFASDAYQRDANYWLAMVPTLPLPLIEKRYPTVQSEALPKAHIHTFSLDRAFYNNLIQFSQNQKSTIYHVLLSALALYFSRTTQQNKIVIGVPVLNRSGAKFKDVLGMFISLSPLVLNVEASDDINQMMKLCGKALRDAYRHQRFPLGDICKRLQMMRNKRDSLFDVVLSYEKQEYSSVPYGNTTMSAHQQFSGVARYPLAVTICEFNDLHDVEVVLEGAENAFTLQDLEMLGNRLQLILEQMVANPQTKICDIDLLPENEKQLLLEQFNHSPEKELFTQSVTQQFQQQVALNPDAIAVEYKTTKLSYQQLDALSNSYAQSLLDFGAKANEIVAICLPRCPEMLVGIFAILKTNAAYLPITPDTPNDRIAEILQQSKAVALLTIGEEKKRLSSLHPNLIILDEPINHQKNSPIELTSNGDDLAYVIFTSGSTGRPKGVMLNHESLAIRLRWLQKTFQISSTDRVAQTIQFSFDPSLIEIFLALTQGACLVLAPAGFQTPKVFAEFIVTQKINAFASVPSNVRNLLQGLENYSKTDLRVICCGGEVLLAKLASDFINKTGARILNVYGPTETVILATAFECTNHSDLPSLPIGRPIDNTRIYVVDNRLQLLPIGTIGEIVIGGDAIAKGYLHQDDLTQERFLPDSHNPTPNSRLYKTGDTGYIGADGQLYFVGRIDNQVKISGYRIELGEIEALLENHKNVHAAAVKIIENNQQKSIYAYVELHEKSAALTSELSKLLRNNLPDYMQPRAIISLDSIPIKSNGKIDYDNLLLPEITQHTVTKKLPSSSLEMQLMQAWRDTLKTNDVSADDNFFELGGDSLAAVTLMVKMEQLFGKRYSLSLLLENPTISQLAEAIQQEQHSLNELPLLISLSENNADIPLYLAASGHGDIMRFTNLAEKLSDICSLSMLQPPSPSDKYKTVEAIAKAYAEAILSQNAPPGYIGGFSIGGIAALETARILIKQGKPPKGILLIDTVYPRWPLKSPVLFWLFRFLAKFLNLDKFVVNGRYLGEMFNDPGIITQLLAWQNHDIKPFDEPVILFISAGMKPIKLWTLSKWSDVFRKHNLIRHSISGSHGEIFLPPHLQVLAEAISYHIR